MIKSTVLAVILSILVTACATYPESEEDQATFHVNEASTQITKGNSYQAGNEIEVALTRPTGKKKVEDLLRLQPKGREMYMAYVEKRIANIRGMLEAKAVLKVVSIASSSDIFTDDEAMGLWEQLYNTVADGNKGGWIPFNLNDDLDAFPVLKEPDHHQIIVDRAIANLQANSGVRLVPSLMEHVKQVGVDSVEGKRIEALLPTMQIRRDELDSVAVMFPRFVERRRGELTTQVLFQVKNGDRLIQEDILKALRAKVRGVEWVSAEAPNVTTLTIERVRHDERSLAERSQTITYSQYQVNLLGAALLMPRNASYLYEVVSGGAEIEYGYVINAQFDGATVHDELIRGNVKQEYRRCQNARIQNVFGGVSSAGFVANDEMRRACDGVGSVSLDKLRDDVFGKITDEVLKVPTIRVVHDAN